jgi:hypothetical protein
MPTGRTKPNTERTRRRCDELGTPFISECVRIEGMIHPHLSTFSYPDSLFVSDLLINDLGGLS